MTYLLDAVEGFALVGAFVLWCILPQRGQFIALAIGALAAIAAMPTIGPWPTLAALAIIGWFAHLSLKMG